MPMYASEKATLDDGRAPVGSASPGANWDSGALQLADALGIDLKLLSRKGAGTSRGVEGDRSFDAVLGQDTPASGHPYYVPVM